MDEKVMCLIGPEMAADLKLYQQWLDERAAAGDVKALVADLKRQVEMLANWDDIRSWSRDRWAELASLEAGSHGRPV
jgi:hypothetical protein